jgi:hypothetical protein
MEYVCFSILAAAFVIVIFFSQRSRKKHIKDLYLGKTAVLGRWEYTPEEWKKFSEDYFPWVRNKDSAGIFSISEDAILISNGRDELYLDLAYRHILMHIEYCDEPPVFHIKLKKLKYEMRGGGKVYYDDFVEMEIPLPPGNAELANRIVERFKEIEKADFEATRSMASSDLVFAQFLNEQPDSVEFESAADEQAANHEEKSN